MTDGRDGFPCWVGADAHGARAYAWESVRLVELIETAGPPEQPTGIYLKAAASIVISHSDGSDRHLGFIGMAVDAEQLIDAAYEAVYSHRRLARAEGKVPSC